MYLCFVMYFTVHIILINFDKHSLDLGRDTCLAPERLKRSISGPRPKRLCTSAVKLRFATMWFRSDANRNRNRKLQTSKAPLKIQAQGTSLFTSAASNQRGFQRIVRGRLRSIFQRVREY